MIRKTLDPVWGLNLGVQACQKKFKPFRHRNTYTSIYLVYKKHSTMLHFSKKTATQHHCRFGELTNSDVPSSLSVYNVNR